MKRGLLVAILFAVSSSFAHHGVASLGTGGLEGPGSPLETSSSATLPEGKWLFYLKLDHVKWRKYSFSQFPDQKESLDDLMDWHFTLYGGMSLPTGNPNRYDRAKDPKGDFEPDMTTGFGKPSLTLGFTATKQILSYPRFTFVFDTNYTKFFENTYNYRKDGSKKKYKFGDEFRLNTAVAYRLYKSEEKKFRADALLEANFQYNGRDEEDKVKLEDSGGNILYGTVGTRLYYKSLSLGVGVKVPVWKKLNREQEQQGSEGKERYRLILTLSTLF